jgi:hypothetical protein
VLAGTRRGRGAKTALAIVALKVGAFAGVQAAALVWDRKGHIGTEESAPAAVGTEDSTAVGGEESADS